MIFGCLDASRESIPGTRAVTHKEWRPSTCGGALDRLYRRGMKRAQRLFFKGRNAELYLVLCYDGSVVVFGSCVGLAFMVLALVGVRKGCC